MNFILVVAILLVGMIVLIKFKFLLSRKEHLIYKFLLVTIVLFIISIIYAWLKSGINPSSYEGFLGLGKMYFSWLGSLFGNIGSIGGYAMNHDWGLNSTILP